MAAEEAAFRTCRLPRNSPGPVRRWLVAERPTFGARIHTPGRPPTTEVKESLNQFYSQPSTTNNQSKLLLGKERDEVASVVGDAPWSRSYEAPTLGPFPRERAGENWPGEFFEGIPDKFKPPPRIRSAIAVDTFFPSHARLMEVAQLTAALVASFRNREHHAGKSRSAFHPRLAALDGRNTNHPSS